MQRPTTPLRSIPKPEPWDIPVTSIQEAHQYDPNQVPARENLTLRELLDKYSLTLGYQNAHLQEVLIVLMTTGKVCVEFRAFNERLQLANFSDIITRPAAIELFNTYLISRKAKTVPLQKEKTRRITVQLPKIDPASMRDIP